MEQNREFLGTEPIGKLLFKLALPTIAAQLINMLYNIVDRIYIGHMPGNGALALTGVGVCLPIIMIVSAFAALVCSGGAPRASIAMGKEDYRAAENILGNCFTLLVIISAALTTVLLLLKSSCIYSAVLFAAIMLMPHQFAGIFSSDPALLNYSVSAIRIYCGALFVFGIQVSAQFTFVSIGNAPCSIIVAVVRKFVLLIPLIYIMPHLVSDSTKGVFMAEPIADFMAVCFTSILFFIQFRKTIQKLEAEAV